MEAIGTDMCIDFGSSAAAMSQQFLDVPQVCTAFQQMRGIAMSKPMQCGRLLDFCFYQGLLQYALQTFFTVGVTRFLTPQTGTGQVFRTCITPRARLEFYLIEEPSCLSFFFACIHTLFKFPCCRLLKNSLTALTT